jgi:hypothetical protein
MSYIQSNVPHAQPHAWSGKAGSIRPFAMDASSVDQMHAAPIWLAQIPTATVRYTLQLYN